MNRVLVIGIHAPGEETPNLEGLEVVDNLASIEGNLALPGGFYTHVVACSCVEEVIDRLITIVSKNGQIDILDIVDHGAPGGLAIGRKALFHVGVKEQKLLSGEAFAQWLPPFMSPIGQLRLLGCNTAVGERGMLLLRLLHTLLGENRIVFGTIMRLKDSHFSRQDGFLLSQEALYSSLAAIDYIAPDKESRFKTIIYWPLHPVP